MTLLRAQYPGGKSGDYVGNSAGGERVRRVALPLQDDAFGVW